MWRNGLLARPCFLNQFTLHRPHTSNAELIFDLGSKSLAHYESYNLLSLNVEYVPDSFCFVPNTGTHRPANNAWEKLILKEYLWFQTLKKYVNAHLTGHPILFAKSGNPTC